MITIIQNRLYAKYTYSGIEPETKHNVRYAHGHLPPNYPMPAIPLACAIHPHVVQIAKAYWFEGDWEFDLVYEYPN